MTGGYPLNFLGYNESLANFSFEKINTYNEYNLINLVKNDNNLKAVKKITFNYLDNFYQNPEIDLNNLFSFNIQLKSGENFNIPYKVNSAKVLQDIDFDIYTIKAYYPKDKFDMVEKLFNDLESDELIDFLKSREPNLFIQLCFDSIQEHLFDQNDNINEDAIRLIYKEISDRI